MKNKIFWIVLGIIILVAILWVAIPELKKLKSGASGTGNPGASGTGGNTSGSSGGTSAPAKLDENKLLYKGSRGAEVRELQNLLNAVQPSNALTADGVFGSLTENKLFSLTGQRQITLATARQLYATYAKNGGTGNLWDRMYGSGSNTGNSTTGDSTSYWDWFTGLFKAY